MSQPRGVDQEGSTARSTTSVGVWPPRHGGVVSDCERGDEIDKLDCVYRERAFVVAALSKCFMRLVDEYDGGAIRSGAAYPVWLGWSESFDPQWRWIVYLELPTGQVSWHIHVDELPLFDGVPRRGGDASYNWDGHSTDEKYRRIWQFVTGQER